MNPLSGFGREIRSVEVPDYLGRLLGTWCSLIERYCARMGPEDAPYDHNERANVGLLSAAAWQIGLIALEEFPPHKKDKDGRCDLWICAEGGDHNGAAFEAKFTSQDLDDPAQVGSVV